jgi:Skp family chaperone for outer membrane proteins
MKKVYLLFFGFILTYSINAQSKAENFAKENTEKLTEVLQLTKTENVQVYDILLERENKFTVLRKKYKDDKNTLRAEIEKLHPIYNRKLKDILGKERIKKYHNYFKSKYNEYLKSKKNKSKDKKVLMAVASYYVSTKGEDSNPGTFNKPFKTILKASKKMKAGDICYIREGFYHEIITLNETHEIGRAHV